MVWGFFGFIFLLYEKMQTHWSLLEKVAVEAYLSSQVWSTATALIWTAPDQ